MASEVKRRRIPAEDLGALPGRYNRNAGPHARLLRRDFLNACQPPGCTKQLFRVEAAWPFAPARRLRAFRLAPKKLVRAPCRPFKATSSRRCRRSPLGPGSARGQPRGVIPCSGSVCAGAEGVPGAHPIDEVGSSDATRRSEILAVSLLLTWPARSSLAASVR